MARFDGKVAIITGAQRFLSVHAATHNTFNVQRHLTSARTHRAFEDVLGPLREALGVIEKAQPAFDTLIEDARKHFKTSK